MNYRYAAYGFGLLGLALLISFVVVPQKGSGLSLFVYVIIPLAALAVALLSVRRHEPLVLNLSLGILTVCYLVFLVLGFFSQFDPAVLAPSDCLSASPLRCDAVTLEGAREVTLSMLLTNTGSLPLDIRYPTLVASLDGLADPGICSVPPDLIVAPYSSFTVSCSFGTVPLAGPVVDGRFGLSLLDNHGQPVQIIGTFSVKYSVP